MSNQQEPGALTPDQINWMQKNGMTIHAVLVPSVTTIESPAVPAGSVDESMVQLCIRIESREEVKIIHSDFVRNTRGDLKKLIREQIKQASSELLSHRFELKAIEPEPQSDAEE